MIQIDKQGIKIAHVLAMSSNNCIGKDNDLPWHISADLQHFKALTQGGIMVLGRKCYDSFGGRPLPKRSHWVMTRNHAWQSGFNNTDVTHVHAVHSIEDALNNAIEEARNKGLATVWIIGGGQIYKDTLHLVDRMEITYIHKEVLGDTFYPQLTDNFLADFNHKKQDVQTDDKSGLSFEFVSYNKTD